MFWLETTAGVREPLTIDTMEEALKLARRIYPTDGKEPEQWLAKKELGDNEDYFLVPGGPACEEFTFMPRSMWEEGGPLATHFDETMTERK